MEEKTNLRDWEKIIVETDEDDPVSIAEITPNDIVMAEGYRVRLTPAER